MDESTLRQKFNEAGFWQRAMDGEFTVRVVRDAPIDRTSPRSRFDDDPLCARSQIVRDLDSERVTIAVVHQYIRHDGSQCARGKPDPKALRIDGVYYVRCKQPA